jgi:hypothetical protein
MLSCCVTVCTSEPLGAFLVSWCSSEGIFPLRIGAASAEIYIERDADWCGQGKNNYFFEGCGLGTCHYGNWIFLPHFHRGFLR